MLGGKFDLGVSWSALRASWRHLKASWKRLGASYSDLGCISDRLRGILRRVGAFKEPSWGPGAHGGSRISGPLMNV